MRALWRCDGPRFVTSVQPAGDPSPLVEASLEAIGSKLIRPQPNTPTTIATVLASTVHLVRDNTRPVGDHGDRAARMSTNRRIYLDFNATAPLVPTARDAMVEAMAEAGNPSSVHA